MIEVNIGRIDITLSFESPALRCHNTFHANGRPSTREPRIIQRSATLCSLNRSSIAHPLLMSVFVQWSVGSYFLSNLFVRETFSNWWIIRAIESTFQRCIVLAMDDVSREVRRGRGEQYAVGEVIVTMVTIWQANERECLCFILNVPQSDGVNQFILS